MLEGSPSLLDNWSLPNVTSFSIFFITLLLFSVAVSTFYDAYKKRPPGPWGLPIVGYLPFIGKRAHVTIAKLGEKYGPVMRLKLGSVDCVVLGTAEAVKEAFVKQNENFSGRPDLISFKTYDNETAFVFLEGEDWKELRTFSVHALRELGFGIKSLEPVVESEVQHFVKALEEESSRHSTGFRVRPILEKSLGNAVCSILLGYRCEYDDTWLNRILEVVDGLLEHYVSDFTFYFPWMRSTPLLSKFIENPKKRALKDELWALWKVKIEDIKKAGTQNEVNFIRSWVNEYQKRLASKDPTAELFSEFNLICNLDSLCQASFETTSTTLQWAFLFMLENPDMQTKLQHEIDEVIGHERVPQYADAKDMPFTRAFIAETHRKGSIIPLGVFHSTYQSTHLMGYWIPKRTVIIPNQYAVHHDPNVFKDPEKFDPSRYLQNGKYVKHYGVMPFSIGKRFCPGEFVAEMEIFLYLTSLLQNYTVVAPQGLIFGCDIKDTFINHPQPYNMIIKRRRP